MGQQDLTAARLRELLHYEPETGVFTRRARTAQRHQVGSRADFPITSGNMLGYRRVSIDSRRYLAHRVAWLYAHGEWPKLDVDHMNGDRGDNRICNLRDVARGVNLQNQRRPAVTNSCGFLGVAYHAPSDKWRARITLNRKGLHIGLYDTPEQAHEAYVATKRKIHEGCTL